MLDTINIIEIFSSIQGEGAYVGYRQVFVRFTECNLSCTYCDTSASSKISRNGLIEITPGRCDFVEEKNPLKLDKIAQYINNLLKLPHHSVSFTGGEPLLSTAAIIKLAPLINAPIFLETNGTLPEQLSAVLQYIDYMSIDIKLPSSCGNSFWYEHKKFLELSADKKAFVKVVVTQQTTSAEFAQAIKLVSDVDIEIPFIIQPVTTANDSARVSPLAILAYQEQASIVLKNVRVIPQTHKLIRLL